MTNSTPPTIASTTIETALSQFSSSILIAKTGTDIGIENFNIYEPNDENYQVAFDELRTTAQNLLTTPIATLNTESSGEEVIVGLGFRQSTAGQGSLFVLFSLLALAESLVIERNRGTLQRLYTLPTPKITIILGKILGAFLFGLIQFTVFIIVGAFFGVDWGNDPLALAILVASYCFMGTALGLALATLVKTSNQAAGLTTLLALTLAPLGGAWWPLDIVPDFMRIIGHISPIAWVMDGFQRITVL